MSRGFDRAIWASTEGLEALLAALGAGTDDTRFVGGCVRDGLLGVAAKDIDLATRLRPEDVVARIARAGFKPVPTGLAHGTVTAVLPGGPVEVTTLRRDVSTDGRRATVAFADDWREDAARRDFTINALYARPSDDTLSDFFGGLPDLEAGRVRFIGEPLARIAEDHLRILRFFRFHARFGRGAPDEAGLLACTARANDLLALSRERIADELLKILGLPDPAPAARLMAAAGVFAAVLPEVDAAGLALLERLIAREQAFAVPPRALRRFAALLPRDPALADQVGARLRLSNDARRELAAAAQPLPPGASARRLRASQPEHSVTNALLLADIPDDQVAAELGALAGWDPPEFPIKGGDLVKLGLRPGPLVAATLAELRREWIAGDFPPEPWLRARAVELVDQALPSSRNR